MTIMQIHEMAQKMLETTEPLDPVYVGNSWLVKMRLIGNGFSFENGKIFYRDIASNLIPEHFMGLPVVAPHPQNEEGKFVDLNSSNFNQYIVGMVIAVRFQDNDRIEGIARVYNNRIMNEIKDSFMSTSSREMVVKYETSGYTLEVITGLDSVAIVPNGFVDPFDPKNKGIEYKDADMKKLNEIRELLQKFDKILN